MHVLGVESILPAWAVLLVAAPMMLFIAGHVVSVQRSAMPRTRRRLRMLNGVLMMLVCALLAYALGIADVPERPRVEPRASGIFVVVWAGIAGLVAVIVLLAVLDALLTASVGLRAHRALRDQAAGTIRADLNGRGASTTREPRGGG